MLKLTLSSFLIVLTVIVSTSFSSEDDAWDRLQGFEPVPGTLVQVDAQSAVGLERNAGTQESAIVMYITPNPSECEENTCLLLVSAFIIYNERGELRAIYGEPDSSEFQYLLFLTDDFVEV